MIRPFSKDALSRYFEHSYCKFLAPIPHVSKFYDAMDRITDPEEWFTQIAQQTLKKLDYQYESVYYDTSTIHFFSQFDELRKKGYGKTGPRGAPLIKLGLSCTEDYLPLSYSIHPGNVSDIYCFKQFLKSDWNTLRKKSTLLSFDAGCYSMDLVLDLEKQGIKYLASADISAFTLTGTPWTVKINDQEWFIQEGVYNDHRIITGYNAEHHQKATEKIQLSINRIRNFAQNVDAKTLDGKRKKVLSLIKSVKLEKVLEVYEEKQTLFIKVNEDKLRKKKDQAKLLVVMSNLDLDAEQLLSKYLCRGEVERVFHYLKTPLATRPVYHWKDHRIRAHFFLIMMGYLQLTALRLFLKQTYQKILTLDKLLEDLRFATCTVIEPREKVFLTFSGKQVSWIRQLLSDWNLPFEREELNVLIEKKDSQTQ